MPLSLNRQLLKRLFVGSKILRTLCISRLMKLIGGVSLVVLCYVEKTRKIPVLSNERLELCEILFHLFKSLLALDHFCYFE